MARLPGVLFVLAGGYLAAGALLTLRDDSCKASI